MPAVSPKQKRFMQAVGHNPAFAKKVGVSQAVGREFDHFAEGGQVDDDDSWLWDDAVEMKDGGRYKAPTKTKVKGEEVDVAPLAPVSSAYAKFMKRPYEPLADYPLFDEARAARIADAYDYMKHAPADPKIRKSYDAMIEETLGQYRALKDAGYEFEFIKPGVADPYAASPAQGYLDLRDRGHLYVFPTESGFGSLTDYSTSSNPLLRRVGRVGDLDNATANDAFRIVHDMYGHHGPGNPFFRHKGEERAWLNHQRMYSPEAVPAMTSETRGQNSWLNFGPYGVHNRGASSADTIYADQKSGLMEPWTWQDYQKGGKVTPKRNIEFVDDLDGLFGEHSRAASKLVRERAETVGKEGFSFGNEFLHSPLVRGEQTRVEIPDAYQRFVEDMRYQRMPFFNTHSHPVVALSPGQATRETMITPYMGADLATTGAVGGMVYPSIGDIRSLGLGDPHLNTMMIEAAGTPHGRVALKRPGPNPLGPSIGFMMQRQPMRREATDRVLDYNTANGMLPEDPTGYSLMINDKLAEIGMPVYMDKRGRTAGENVMPLRDMLPDFKGYLDRHNVGLW